MENIKIATDKRWREMKFWEELPDKVRKEFEELPNAYIRRYIPYKGRWYTLNDFMSTSVEGWDGVLLDHRRVVFISYDRKNYRIGVAYL